MAVMNNIYGDEITTLEKLEQIQIAQRIVFEKIVVMHEGQRRKIKGCNMQCTCRM